MIGLLAGSSSNPRRMRSDEYADLLARGVLDGERIELLRGSLVAMSPIDPDHDEAVSTLGEILVRGVAERGRVRVQSSFIAGDESVPLPDLVLAPAGSYRHRHPAHALLLVEVARTSLARDRDEKASVYAASAVDEYWVVNLRDQRIEVHRTPVGGAWTERAVYERGSTVTIVAFPDVTIAVDDLFAGG